MILFQSVNVIVEYDDSIPCVVWSPKEYLSGEVFRTSFSTGVEYIAQNIKRIPNIGWLNDIREMKPPKKEDMEWVLNYVNSRAKEVGLLKNAFILPKAAFGRMIIRTYAFMSSKLIQDSKLQIKAFNTIEEARLWLKGVEGIEKNEIKLSINQK